MNREELFQAAAIATQAAREAGDYLRENLGTLSPAQIEVKAAFDFVSEIDRHSEAILISHLREQYPGHRFFTEESVRDERHEYRWIIDPLDGTTNYVHALPAFSISMALERDDAILVGLVFDPMRDELFLGIRGAGASLNGRSIAVSKIQSGERALVATGFPFRRKHLLQPYLRSFNDIFMRVSGIRRIGSAALDLSYVACGRLDGYWELGLSPWDAAAGALIVREAGGRVTDFSGGDDAIWSGQTVASNQFLHPLLLNSCSEHLLPALKE